MAREVDKRKTRKALRKLKRVADRAGACEAKPLTDWEKDFVQGVGERLETYGSAFCDPQKGSLEEALSARQADIVRTLDRKTRSKAKASDPKAPDKSRKGLARKTGLRSRSEKSVRKPQAEDSPETPESRRAAFRVIASDKG